MGKKMMTGMIVLAFICSSFLLMTSCAKKQIQVSEPVQPATQEVKAEGDEAKAAEEAKSAAEQEARDEADLETLRWHKNWLMKSAILKLRISTLHSTGRI